MADEIMEAIQMLRFGYDGIKLGLDVTGSSIREAKNLTIFIVGLLNHEKTQGKTSLKKMLKNSGNLQVLQIKEKDVKEFEKLALTLSTNIKTKILTSMFFIQDAKLLFCHQWTVLLEILVLL